VEEGDGKWERGMGKGKNGWEGCGSVRGREGAGGGDRVRLRGRRARLGYLSSGSEFLVTPLTGDRTSTLQLLIETQCSCHCHTASDGKRGQLLDGEASRPMV